jgi:hypothetical protein
MVVESVPQPLSMVETLPCFIHELIEHLRIKNRMTVALRASENLN